MTASAAARNGRKRLDELAERSGRELVRFLRGRLANGLDAEDLAQEVYLRLLRMEHVDGICNYRAYAMRVAANVAHEWQLLARNRLTHSSEPLESLVDTADPTRDVLVEQQMRALEAALETLSPKCRAVVLLHRRERFTCKEISERLGLSVGMVKKYLAHGIAVCQAKLSFQERGSPDERE